MAQLNIKNKRRYRVQISISQATWQKYDANLKAAQSLNVEIDYSQEFEIWFKRQNDDVQRKLAEMSTPVVTTTPAPGPVSALAHAPVPVANKAAATTEVPAKNTPQTGGDYNGND
jgi:hypothetical protein